jgi:hypothetical protein
MSSTRFLIFCLNVAAAAFISLFAGLTGTFKKKKTHLQMMKQFSDKDKKYRSSGFQSHLEHVTPSLQK